MYSTPTFLLSVIRISPSTYIFSKERIFSEPLQHLLTVGHGWKTLCHSSETSYFVCGTSMISCLVVQRRCFDLWTCKCCLFNCTSFFLCTSKHLGHNSSSHFLNKRYSTLVLSVLSNLPKGQVELKVGQGKQKIHLPTRQVHLFFFFFLALNVINRFCFNTLGLCGSTLLGK